MKIVFASDVHGSLYAMNDLTERIAEEKPDKAIFVGDFCGFGNAEKFRSLVKKITCPIVYVEGNCDHDDVLSSYGLESGRTSHIEILGDRRVFITHGHIYNRSRVPDYLTDGDVFVYGHLHKPFIIKEKGIIFVNDGSMARPREGSKPTYAVLTDEKVYIKDGKYGEILEVFSLN